MASISYLQNFAKSNSLPKKKPYIYFSVICQTNGSISTTKLDEDFNNLESFMWKFQLLRLDRACPFCCYCSANFSLNWPSGPIQSLNYNVCQSSVSVFVSLPKPRFTLEWRLLVEECIANIGISLDISGFLPFE